MKMNDKMKGVQRKYREEETVTVVTIIVLFIFFTYTLQGF
ncbi:hypothetical protein [Bacillus velezensis]|nr:hypothetical protein [Bacillus velezensis]MDR7909418.1 hypothetical protein [Bacillus velezensis]